MKNLCVPFLFIVPDLIGLGKMRYKLRSSKQPRLSEPRHVNSLTIKKGEQSCTGIFSQSSLERCDLLCVNHFQIIWQPSGQQWS